MAVKWSGLLELERDLSALPATVTADTGPLVEKAATGAASDIRAQYPARTGKLRDGVKVKQTSRDPTRIRWTVSNRSKLATIFEYGTAARQTALGADRGSMPAGKVFIPNAIRQRKLMYEQIRDVLRGQGATVTG